MGHFLLLSDKFKCRDGAHYIDRERASAKGRGVMHFFDWISDLEGAIFTGGHDKRSAPRTTDVTDMKSYCVRPAQHVLQRSEEEAYQTKNGCVLQLKLRGISPESSKVPLLMETSE